MLKDNVHSLLWNGNTSNTSNTINHSIFCQDNQNVSVSGTVFKEAAKHHNPKDTIYIFMHEIKNKIKKIEPQNNKDKTKQKTCTKLTCTHEQCIASSTSADINSQLPVC